MYKNNVQGTEATKKGVSLTTIVAIVLAILKICEVAPIATWSWWVIVGIWLAPVILFVGIFAVVLAALVIIAIIEKIFG